MKRFGLGILVVLAVTGFALRKTITLRLVERNMASSLLDELPDGLHVAILRRLLAATGSEALGAVHRRDHGERIYLVDVGAGSSRVLSRTRVPQGKMAGVLLTHFHSDHIDGLGELLIQRWANAS